MKTILKFAIVSAAFVSNISMATPFGFAADANSNSPFITQGYQGFNYGGKSGAASWVNEIGNEISSEYSVGPTTLGAAWSNGGELLSLTSATAGQTFGINSVSLNTGDTVSVTIDGLLMGNLMHSWTGDIVNQTDYTNVMLNWNNIDTLNFSDGVLTPFFVTNIDVQSSNVPEPGSLALLGLGFAGLAAVRRRKQS